MRDSVNPEDGGGETPQKNPRVKALNGWYVFLGLLVAALVGAMFMASA